jgi:hypothetical protein
VKTRLEVTVTTSVRAQTAEQEAAFWSALDGFVEEFVRHQIRQLNHVPQDDISAEPDEREHTVEHHGHRLTDDPHDSVTG